MNQPLPEHPPEELYLCMGSACHQMGVYEVLPRLQQLLEDHGLERRVELKGAFCLEQCADGIVLRHRGRLILRVNPRNVDSQFRDQILPMLKKALERGGRI